MRLCVANSPIDAGGQAAAYIAHLAQRSAFAGQRFRLAFSGGSTAEFLLAALIHSDLPWSVVDVFQVDERFAETGSVARNLTRLEQLLVHDGLLAKDQLHAMPVQTTVTASAVGEYETLLQTILGVPPVFDLVHLGLGDDGHTASLIPGDPVIQEVEHCVALTRPYQGHRRMTLTAPILNGARRRVWLVTGASKSTVLPRLLSHDSDIPGGMIAARQSIVFADKAAASAILR
jgi:6-phosphogluconolactonase